MFSEIFSRRGINSATFDHIGMAVDMIKRHEGWRDSAYWDLTGASVTADERRGHVTIGYGFRLDRPGALPEDIADEWLRKIVMAIDEELEKRIKFYRRLHPKAKAVLLDMAYNMGVAGLLKFSKTLGELRRGNYAAAASEMLDSRWASQVGRRARENADIIRSLA